MSTASCSSPKELTQAVPPQEAVLTLKAMVLKASPMHIISLISPLSEVAFVRNSSCNHKAPINLILSNHLHTQLHGYKCRETEQSSSAVDIEQY